jgi:hypothetical protein
MRWRDDLVGVGQELANRVARRIRALQADVLLDVFMQLLRLGQIAQLARGEGE